MRGHQCTHDTCPPDDIHGDPLLPGERCPRSRTVGGPTLPQAAEPAKGTSATRDGEPIGNPSGISPVLTVALTGGGDGTACPLTPSSLSPHKAIAEGGTPDSHNLHRHRH